MRRFRYWLGVFMAMLVVAPLSGSTILVDAFYTGKYSSAGNHSSGSLDYWVGPGAGTADNRSFFAFHIPILDGIVTGIELSLWCDTNCYGGSGTTTTEFSVWDVTTAVNVVTASHSGSAGLPVYADLGSGTLYGSTLVGMASEHTNVTIALNSDAVSGVQAALGSDFAVGGALPDGSVAAFRYSSGSEEGTELRQLQITYTDAGVPEPATWGLFACGIALVTAARRWRLAGRPPRRLEGPRR